MQSVITPPQAVFNMVLAPISSMCIGPLLYQAFLSNIMSFGMPNHDGFKFLPFGIHLLLLVVASKLTGNAQTTPKYSFTNMKARSTVFKQNRKTSIARSRGITQPGLHSEEGFMLIQ